MCKFMHKRSPILHVPPSALYFIVHPNIHIVAYPAALPKSLALADCCFCKSQSDELKTEEQERMTGDSTAQAVAGPIIMEKLGCFVN